MARLSFTGIFAAMLLVTIGLQVLCAVEAVENTSYVLDEAWGDEQDNMTDANLTDMDDDEFDDEPVSEDEDISDDELEDSEGELEEDSLEDEEEEEEEAGEVVDPFANVSTPMTISLADGKLHVMMRKADGNEELFTLEFGSARELDSEGQVVQGRSLSIAQASWQDEAIFTSEVGIISGALALVTRLFLPLAVDDSCEARTSGKSRSGKGSSGKSFSGKGSSGKSFSGKGSSGKSSSGKSGKGSSGEESSGKQSSGEESSGKGSSGEGSSQKGSNGKGSAGKGSSNKGSSGKESSGKGSSGKGSSSKGSSTKGSSEKGSGGKGSSGKGSSDTGPRGKGSSGKGASGKGSGVKGSSQKGSSGKGSSGKGHAHSNLGEMELDANSSSYFAIEAFVFLEDAMIEYGEDVVEVHAGEMKFNIESSEWPFCGDDHSLRVDVGMKLHGENHSAALFSDIEDDAEEDLDQRERRLRGKGSRKSGRSARGPTKGSQRAKGRSRGTRGKMLIADSGFDEVFLSMPTVAILDGNETNCTVGLEEKASSLWLSFSFPHFDETLFYDPVGGSTTFDYEAWQTSALEDSDISPMSAAEDSSTTSALEGGSNATSIAGTEPRIEFAEHSSIDEVTSGAAPLGGFRAALSVIVAAASAVGVRLRV